MKSSCCVILASLFLFTAISGQTSSSEFIEPWRDTNKAFVLDPFRKNTIDWEELAKEPRVAGIIHKASEPVWNKQKRKYELTSGSVDSKYAERKAEGKKRGYKWGSYHIGRSGIDPVKQADFYLETTHPTEDEVLALDIENTSPSDMSIDDALLFIKRIKEKTGHYPLLYIPERVRKAILSKYGADSEFAKTPLWYARYCLDLRSFFPTVIWSSYTLLQFASEINCPTTIGSKRNCPLPKEKRCPLPAPIPGTTYDIDVNVYNGTVEELRSKWPFTVK
jgi:hypothetical protein